jgi:hypothetical protein
LWRRERFAMGRNMASGVLATRRLSNCDVESAQWPLQALLGRGLETAVARVSGAPSVESVSARTRQRVAALEQRLEHSDRGPGSRALKGVCKFRAGSAARAAQVAAWHALEPDALDTLSPNATTLVPCASARAGAGAPLLRGARTTARLVLRLDAGGSRRQAAGRTYSCGLRRAQWRLAKPWRRNRRESPCCSGAAATPDWLSWAGISCLAASPG